MDVKPQKTSRKMRWLLGISLALNLLVIGAVVGSSLSGGPGRPDRGARAAEGAIGVYGRALNKSERREVGLALRSGSRGVGPALRSELRALVQEAVAVLRADPYVAAAFQDVLSRQQALIKSRADDAQTALTDYVSQMTPQERSAYADRLSEVLERRPSRK